MPKATAPIDLLRELRVGFEAEGKQYREMETNPVLLPAMKRATGAKAYAAEQAVKRIDATLRDWA